LRKETAISSLRTVFDVVDDQTSDARKLWMSVSRPAAVFFGSSVLQAISIQGSLTFTFFYIMSTSLPDILLDLYGLSRAQTGAAFVSFSVGSVIAVTICNLSLDRIYVHLKHRSKDGNGQPEYRLPLVIVGSVTLPLAVVCYGWIAQKQAPLPVLLMTIIVMGLTLMLGFMPIMAYVVDATGVYSASAMTAVIVTRCLLGTFLPLTTGPLVAMFGYGWGFTILGTIALTLAPIPMVVFRYGERWRQRSRYTKLD